MKRWVICAFAVILMLMMGILRHYGLFVVFGVIAIHAAMGPTDAAYSGK